MNKLAYLCGIKSLRKDHNNMPHLQRFQETSAYHMVSRYRQKKGVIERVTSQSDYECQALRPHVSWHDHIIRTPTADAAKYPYHLFKDHKDQNILIREYKHISLGKSTRYTSRAVHRTVYGYGFLPHQYRTAPLQVIHVSWWARVSRGACFMLRCG